MIIYMQDFSPIFLKLQNADFKKIQKPGSREPGIQNDALLCYESITSLIQIRILSMGVSCTRCKSMEVMEGDKGVGLRDARNSGHVWFLSKNGSSNTGHPV
jgi:hypothetical protein